MLLSSTLSLLLLMLLLLPMVACFFFSPLSSLFFQAELISQEKFTRQVQECMILFEESQKCMSMLVKK